MSNAVHAVESKWHRNAQFNRELGGNGQSTEGRNERRRFQMPAHSWSNEVGRSKDVQTTGEDRAGDTVEGRQVPGNLGLIDREMWGNGAVEALLGKDLSGIGGLVG